jgi:hypothetical protein
MTRGAILKLRGEKYGRIDLPPLPYDADNVGAPPLEIKRGVETVNGMPEPNDIPSSVGTIAPTRVEARQASSCSVVAERVPAGPTLETMASPSQ